MPGEPGGHGRPGRYDTDAIRRWLDETGLGRLDDAPDPESRREALRLAAWAEVERRRLLNRQLSDQYVHRCDAYRGCTMIYRWLRDHLPLLVDQYVAAMPANCDDRDREYLRREAVKAIDDCVFLCRHDWVLLPDDAELPRASIPIPDRQNPPDDDSRAEAMRRLSWLELQHARFRIALLRGDIIEVDIVARDEEEAFSSVVTQLWEQMPHRLLACLPPGTPGSGQRSFLRAVQDIGGRFIDEVREVLLGEERTC